ncbi:nucleolar protein,Nop52-domain-containing protein [Chytriomyces sp. MP71]|nr:nucleolar protein,Nop52-domain-containing protein [Chytriomyces sp. MP71]
MSQGFGKSLAHTDKAVRDKAIEALGTWLRDADALTPKTMLGLWKGMFYCYWMSDKPLVQHELAERLAGLAISLEDSSKSLLYINGFWSILVREWFGIDRLRLDKFYNLIRNFHRAAFAFLEKNSWEASLVEEYVGMLEEGVLSVNNIRVPDSLRYHTCEVYLEELNKGVMDDIPNDIVLLLLRPFKTCLATSTNNILLEKLGDFFGRIVDTQQNIVRYEDEPEKKDWALRMDKTGIAMALHALLLVPEGEDGRLPPRNRRAVHGVVKRFLDEGGVEEGVVVLEPLPFKSLLKQPKKAPAASKRKKELKRRVEELLVDTPVDDEEAPDLVDEGPGEWEEDEDKEQVVSFADEDDQDAPVAISMVTKSVGKKSKLSHVMTAPSEPPAKRVALSVKKEKLLKALALAREKKKVTDEAAAELPKKKKERVEGKSLSKKEVLPTDSDRKGKVKLSGAKPSKAESAGDFIAAYL